MPSSILNSDDGVISGTAGLKNSGGDDAVLLIQTKGVTAQTVDAGQRTMFPTTIGVGGATPSTSGSGISFPASASASTDANTLDDYEEGTWTPSLGGNTTYTTQAGRYTKIGNFVYATGIINVNTIGTGSTTQIQGFPFTAGGTDGRTYAGSVAFFTAINSNIVSFYLRLNPGNTVVTVASMLSASTAPDNNSIFKNSARMDFAVGYFV